MASAVNLGSTAELCAVLVCQSCPHVWELGSVAPEEFGALVRTGCPECGGWVWLGELVDGVAR